MSTDVESERIELAIGGMTCASCANRIERKLNKMDGVTATVNYATEKASVEFAAGCLRTSWSPRSSRWLHRRAPGRIGADSRRSRTTGCARCASG